MATGNKFNLYTTYYERFLALSVSIKVGKLHQLKLETPRPQAPVLRYKDITFTSEYIKESLSAVCPVLGVHNVARVRMLGSLLLIEVDFTEMNALEKFCKSLFSGQVQMRLQERFKLKENLYSLEQDIDVILKLHLVLPNAEKKSVASREVTTDNYEECFTLIRESALFEFQSLKIAHDAFSEEITQPDLIGINDIHELFEDLLEVMANWFTVGVYLKVDYYILEAIQKDCRDQSKDCLIVMLAAWLRGGNASSVLLVQALGKAGFVVLANKMAVKHGVTGVSGIAKPKDTHLSSTDKLAVTDTGVQDQLQSHALAEIRKEIVTKDTQCSSFSVKLGGLKKKESEVMESLEQTKSSLVSAIVKIDELKCDQQSLIEKRTTRQSSKKWLIRQKSNTFGEDLIELNQVIKETEEAVDELSQKIDELEEMIMNHKKQAEQFKVEQLRREKERKELKMKIDEIQKEKEDLDYKLKEDRKKFEEMLKQSEIRMKFIKDELDHKRKVELAQANMRALIIASPLLNEHLNTKMDLMKDDLPHRRELELPQANTESLIAPPLLDEHIYKHDGYLWIKRVPSGKKLTGLFSWASTNTKWVSVFAVLDDSNIQFYQEHKKAEQPTAHRKSAIDSFHLLHATCKISELKVNTKGKKIKHIIELTSPTEKELHLGVDALNTIKEWFSAIQAAINHTDQITPDKSAVMLMDASFSANNVKSKYKVFLKHYYRDPLPNDDKLFISNCNRLGYAELEISEKNAKLTSEMEKKNGDSPSSTKYKSQSIIALNDILTPHKEGKPVHLVLIEGTSGIGKTTLAWQLCHKWAKEELDSLKDYDLVVLVRLRKKRAQNATKLKHLLPYKNTTDMKELEAALGSGEGVLIVCDGFDELPHHQQGKEFYVRLFSGELLPAATVIVTTRPSVSDVFKDVIGQNIDRELEITGFTRNGIMEFAQSVFSTAALDGFLSYIQNNPPINSMMYLPLSAVIVAKIYEESYKTDTPFPNTMSELFDAFTRCLVRKHFESKGQKIAMPSSLRDINKIPLVASHHFKVVCKIAYDGICDNLYYFDELPEEFEHLDLMRRYTRENIACGRYATFVFFHQTLQEYLAALHIANQPTSALSLSKPQFEKKEMITRFLAGLCRNDRHDYYSDLRQWLVEFFGQTCFDRLQALQLVHCAYECPSIMPNLKVEYSERNAFIVVEPEVGIDWYAMGYCISHFDKKWGLHATSLRKENIDLLEKGLKYSNQTTTVSGTFKYLHISKSEVSVSTVITSLGEFCQLECLELLYVKINEDDEEALKKLIAAKSGAKSLTYRTGNKYTHTRCLIPMLFGNSSLEELIVRTGSEVNMDTSLLPHSNTNLKKLTISCELVQPLAALLPNTSLTHLVVDSLVVDSDLPMLKGLIESHSTLQVLELGKIVDYASTPKPAYTSLTSVSRNLHQLIEVAISSCQLNMLKLHEEDYDYLPAEYHSNSTVCSC